jgi:DnaK suppressor protein
MTSHLTTAQRAVLEATLRDRQRALDRAVEGRGGGSRAEHAREVLLQDGDDAAQRDSDREVDLARTDREMVELGEVSRALARLSSAAFGRCDGCGAEIPFDRLRLEPWATRCVTCQALAERKA